MAFKTSWKLSILALTIVPPITYSYRLWARLVVSRIDPTALIEGFSDEGRCECIGIQMSY